MSASPLLMLREHTLSFNESRQPMTLQVYEDRVECTKPRLIAKGSTDTIRYEQVAQVVIHQGLVWSALAVETNGGGGFRIGGLKKEAASQAKAAIDEGVARLRTTSRIDAVPTPSATPSPSIAGELATLRELHEAGALTEAEFAAAKGKLLS